jgi:hypothetical protein
MMFFATVSGRADFDDFADAGARPIYDQPLQVRAVLLGVGFLVTRLVRPLSSGTQDTRQMAAKVS